jgi:hypothetical protein
MLTNLGRQFRSWFRPRSSVAPGGVGAVPMPPPIPEDETIALEDLDIVEAGEAEIRLWYQALTATPGEDEPQ